MKLALFLLTILINWNSISVNNSCLKNVIMSEFQLPYYIIIISHKRNYMQKENEAC